jgi:hypothetical protein
MRKAFPFVVFVVALLVLEAAVVWRPFTSRLIAYDSGQRHGQPAGQIVPGFHLTQQVPGDLYRPHLPRRSITHWRKANARLYKGHPNCFAMRFATYARKDSGHISVGWQQGTKTQQWRLDASSLRDNKFVDFCPSAGLDSSQPFQVSVDGIDSIDGHAATLWLGNSDLDPALVNGKPAGGRSTTLQLTYRNQLGPPEILRSSRGAFAFACLCSLAIGMLVLVAVRLQREPKPGNDAA